MGVALKRLLLLAFLFVWFGSGTTAQGVHVESAPLPKDVVPLGVAVGGRSEIARPEAMEAFAPQGFVYQWPGTYFEAAFRGDSLFLQTGKGRQGMHLIVDGRQAIPFVSAQASIFRVAGLSRGSHTVRLEVVTESQAAPNTFAGFLVPTEGKLATPVKKSRQIEFIGDSYTVGYGNTSGERSCSQEEIWSTTDNSAAFGPLLAQHFGAEYQVNAISGRGVVRNYNGGRSSTLPQAYPFVLFDKQQTFVDAGWRPQVVVVGLGTNDFSTPLNPGEPWTTREQLHADYEKTYISFLRGLRERDPNALLVVWATDGEGGEIEAEAGAVVERLRTDGDTRIAFLPVAGLEMSACDSHPSAADDRTLFARMRELLEAYPDVWHGEAGRTPSAPTRP